MDGRIQTYCSEIRRFLREGRYVELYEMAGQWALQDQELEEAKKNKED